MRIVGIGTDIVEIRRINAALERHGERFAGRILTSAEHEEWLVAGGRAPFLARRFAAKEAVSKALGCGIGAALSFHDLRIGHDDWRAPMVEFLGRGRETVAWRGVEACHLSISDEQSYALAFVVLVGISGAGRPSGHLA